MESFIWFIFSLGAIWLAHRKLRESQKQMQEDLDALTDRVSVLDRKIVTLAEPASASSSRALSAGVAAAVFEAARKPEPQEIAPVTLETMPTSAAAEYPDVAERAQRLDRFAERRDIPAKPSWLAGKVTALRLRFEQRIMANWTGILGAVVVVAGVTFVGVYTALRLAPLYRFLMTLAAAAAFLGTSAFLGRKEGWRDFSNALRSAGAAILLFACAASGGLPGLGLQWIDSPLPALALLVFGICVNLYLAYAGGGQALATFHVLLSLLPLAIVPATLYSLLLGTAVCLFGVALGLRTRWDRHLACMVAAYTAFHLVWAVAMGPGLRPESSRWTAVACAAVVLGGAALVHHRKDRASSPGPTVQVLVHLSALALLTAALFAHVPSSPATGALLLVLASLAAVLGRRARRAGVEWLHRSDTLAAQGLILLSLTSGPSIGANFLLLILIAFAETVAFRAVVAPGEDAVLDRVADVLPVITGAGLAYVGLMQVPIRSSGGIEKAVLLAAGAVVAVAGQRLIRAPRVVPPVTFSALLGGEVSEQTKKAALGWYAGAYVVLALLVLQDRSWVAAAAWVAGSAMLVALRRTARVGLSLGALVLLVCAHGIVSGRALSANVAPSHLWVELAPLSALAAAGIGLVGAGALRQVAILLLGFDVALAVYAYGNPVSSFIPGVGWLLISVVALEVAHRLPRRESGTMLLVGYGSIVAFLWAYAAVIVQSPGYVGALRARLLVEILALGVFLYWWLFRPRPETGEHARWVVVHPWFLDLLMVGAAVTVVVEVVPYWWSVIWGGIALALFSPRAERLLDGRVRTYSLLFYWLSVADMAIVLSTMEVPSPRWVDQPRFTSMVAIGLQVLYAAWSRRRVPVNVVTPATPDVLPGGPLSRLKRSIAARPNPYVFYPLFAGIAVFVYWRFDHAVLSLIWSAEAFALFVLSAWLRENQFRFVALAGLGICLMRLVLIDLAQANLGFRGLIFIGVGLLMLGMNAIYTRFRVRFQS